MSNTYRRMQNKKKMKAEKILNDIWDIMLHNDKCGTCSLTGVHYDNYGNNAYPFEGRCCDEANEQYVIPARILGIKPITIKILGKERIMKTIDRYHKEGKFKFQSVTAPIPISEFVSLGINR